MLRAVVALCTLVLVAGCGPAAAPQPPAAAVRPAYTAADLAEPVSIFEVAIAPDASELAFVSDASGELELWTASLADRESPAVQRTRLGESVSDVFYGSDGTIYFAADTGGDERTDLWSVAPGSNEPVKFLETPTLEAEPRLSRDGTRVVLTYDPGEDFRFNTGVLELATKELRQLTDFDENVYDPNWSPDGTTIVASRSPDDVRSELLVIDVATGTIRELPPPLEGGSLWPVGFLPDGRLLATGANDRGFEQLVAVTLADGAAEWLGPADWDVEAAEVADDGRIVFARNVRGASELAVATAESLRTASAARVLSTAGVVADLVIDPSGRTVAAAIEDPRHPTAIVVHELATSDSYERVPATLGRVAPELLAGMAVESFAAPDGRPVDAWLWEPPVARLGAPPPCAVHVHGGPNGQVRPWFYPQCQALAEAGFLVVSVNYRGSTGYGTEWEDLNNGDWGGGDLQDILAVVRGLEAAGRIDPARVGIFGGSYGGYMTLRAITAAPEVWGAAVELYGMPDLLEDYELTKDRFGDWYLTEMGDPAAVEALYRDRSPIHALDRVTAPLLVFQGANDTNVPQAESDSVVEALRSRGHPVEYVVYPDEGHEFMRRENRVDWMTKTVDFFVRHLGTPRTP